MIKKINIALVAAFAAILLANGLKGLVSGGDKPRSRETASAGQASAPSVPSVNIYFVRWAKYAMKNKVTNRNGVLLDQMRAIFPGSSASYLNGNAVDFAEKMSQDPAAVVVGFGDHPDFKGCRRAPTPLAMASLVVRTQRNNTWRYKGPESIDSLRLIVRSSLLDYSAVRKRVEQQSGGPGKMIVVDSGTSLGEIMERIESGEADGFLATGEGKSAEVEMSAAQMLQRFRTSAPIAADPVYLYVSSVNPEFADAVIDAYENGLRRIDESGERARIFAYYGMVPEPLPESGKSSRAGAEAADGKSRQ